MPGIYAESIPAFGAVLRVYSMVLVPLQKSGGVSDHIALPNQRYYLQTFRFAKRKGPGEHD